MKEINYNINDLREVMKKLLSEKGCSWDKAQTHKTLRKYLIEECYEAIDAINNNDMGNLCEELGDILFQVVFHSELAQREGYFNLDTVINNITAKMIYRHPHVFSDTEAKNNSDIIKNWDKLKEKEKGYKNAGDVLKAIPKALPSLIRAQKTIGKAQKYKLDTETYDKIADNIVNISNSLKGENISQKEEFQEIIGNLLLNLTKISQILEINADFSLTNALETYINKVEDI